MKARRYLSQNDLSIDGRTAVVLAGGMGSRINEVTKGLIPKALIPINGQPFISYKLESLVRMGFETVKLLVGHQGEMIERYVKRSSEWPLEISVHYDGPTLLGTGGAVREIAGQLPSSFWVTYADTYVLAELNKIENKFHSDERVLTVYDNKNTSEISNVDIRDNVVLDYQKGAPDLHYGWLDYGLFRLRREDICAFDEGTEFDLGEVFESLIRDANLHAFEVTHRFWDVGTPASIAETSVEFSKREWDFVGV